MFGYVNVNQKELTKEQKDSYQSYYCGLCRSLKEVSGAKGPMLLNYDMTFLTILLTGLYEPQVVRQDFTCMIHPVGKKVAKSSEATTYAAKMNVLLSYQSMEDDWTDNRSLTKKSMAKMFSKDYERIKQEYPRQAKAVEDYIRKLSVAEMGNEKNLDAVSGLTGEMLAEIFDWKQDEWSEELRCMGFYLGKFVYLMDAYEDLEKDEQRGLYNPFLSWKEDNKGTDLDTFVRLILTSMLAECAKSFERLPIINYADILRNILYSGVWTRFEVNQLKKKKKKSTGDLSKEEE
ncbi:MAG: DUF5685 family protein [Lachnospiraceae bacterium]